MFKVKKHFLPCPVKKWKYIHLRSKGQAKFEDKGKNCERCLKRVICLFFSVLQFYCVLEMSHCSSKAAAFIQL